MKGEDAVMPAPRRSAFVKIAEDEEEEEEKETEQKRKPKAKIVPQK